MLRKIIVPLDGSTLAERALAAAAQLAAHDAAQVTLLRVPEPVRMLMTAADSYGLLFPQDSFATTEKEALDYLQRMRSWQAGRGFLVATDVISGDPAGVITDAARQRGADLIAMSSHGYSGLTRWILGSVAERVLRGADCPVLVVRSAQPIRRMLITLDGSPIAADVLMPALDVAQGLQAKVTLLRVVPAIGSLELAELDEFETGLGSRLGEEYQDEARAYLEPLVERFTSAGLEAGYIVRAGPSAEEILQAVADQEIDLVAMATHGRTGLRRWIYGSVTEKVLHSAHCSMLIVRPAAHELRLSLARE